MASVGRATYTLRKSTQGVWPRLLKGSKKPANMHTWWEMQERFEKENKATDDAKRAEIRKAKEANKDGKQDGRYSVAIAYF